MNESSFMMRHASSGTGKERSVWRGTSASEGERPLWRVAGSCPSPTMRQRPNISHAWWLAQSGYRSVMAS
jgi:hypothetical protein